VRAVALVVFLLLMLPTTLAQAQTCPPGTTATSAGCVTIGEALGLNAPPPPTVVVVTPTATPIPTPPTVRPSVSGAYVYDLALSSAYAPIQRAPDRAAFARMLPPDTAIIADPRTLSIILHTHGPLSWIDDRVNTSTNDVIFRAIPATAYGTQNPPAPCRGGLAYVGTANARSGDIGAGAPLVPGQPSSQVTGENQPGIYVGDCSTVTYTVRAD
jgi:hypothetical protein